MFYNVFCLYTQKVLNVELNSVSSVYDIFTWNKMRFFDLRDILSLIYHLITAAIIHC